MVLLQKILNKLNGMHYAKEYITLPLEKHNFPLKAQLALQNKIIADVTQYYLMTGINPLIFALPSLPECDLSLHTTITIVYTSALLQPGSIITQKNIAAKLELKKIRIQKMEDTVICYFEVTHGMHCFLPLFNQVINRLYNRLYHKKKDNIYPRGNLYTQLQTAYCIPQVISLITLGKNGLYNSFPTDQHGQINGNYYIITLRHAGMACRQVEEIKKIVISNIDACHYKDVYSLGKNHMQPLKPAANFNFGEVVTQIFRLPLPLNTVECRELELVEFFMHGIHKVFLFKLLSCKKIDTHVSTLACINNAYATWRFKHRLPCDYFIEK